MSVQVHFGTPQDNFKRLIQELKEEFDYVCEDNDQLYEQLNSWNKDTELDKANKRAEWHRTHSLHTLPDDELEAIKEFRYEHYCSCHNGNTYQYELSGQGIGTTIKIRCPKCGIEKDITDYSSW